MSLENKKQRKEITNAGTKKLLKSQIPHDFRISEKAVKQVQMGLEDYAKCVGEKALKLAKHRKAKTISEEDMKLALQDGFCKL